MRRVSSPARSGMGGHRVRTLTGPRVPAPDPGTYGPATERLLGAVMMGGRSRRFGADKALAPIGDTMMGAIVVNALRDAGLDPVVALGGTAGPTLNLITVPDRWPGEGPLAALATILRWARQGRVLVVPCDLPRLNAAVVRTLVDAADALDAVERAGTAVIATVDGVPRHSVGVWPTAWSVPIRRMVADGERRFAAALDAGPWIGVAVPAPALADADTPEELFELLDEQP